MPLLMRTQVLYAKAEASYGVEPSPVLAGTDAVLTSGLSITPLDGPTVSRDLNRSTLGNDRQLRTGSLVKVSFSVEVAGAAPGSAPAYGALLSACKLTGAQNSPNITYKYTPNSLTTDGSCYMAFQMGGQQHKISGARGNVSLAMDAGTIPKWNFEFTGLYSIPTTTTALVPNWSDYRTPVPVTNTNTTAFTVHTIASVMSKFSLNLNNQVIYRNVVGSESVLITDRAVGGSMTFEAPAITTKNWFDSARQAATGALSIIHGAGASPANGNVLTIASSYLQLVNPTYAEEDGIAMIQSDYVLIPSDTGNDEVTFTFS